MALGGEDSSTPRKDHRCSRAQTPTLKLMTPHQESSGSQSKASGRGEKSSIFASSLNSQAFHCKEAALGDHDLPHTEGDCADSLAAFPAKDNPAS